MERRAPAVVLRHTTHEGSGAGAVRHTDRRWSDEAILATAHRLASSQRGVSRFAAAASAVLMAHARTAPAACAHTTMRVRGLDNCVPHRRFGSEFRPRIKNLEV